MRLSTCPLPSSTRPSFTKSEDGSTVAGWPVSLGVSFATSFARTSGSSSLSVVADLIGISMIVLSAPGVRTEIAAINSEGICLTVSRSSGPNPAMFAIDSVGRSARVWIAPGGMSLSVASNRGSISRFTSSDAALSSSILLGISSSVSDVAEKASGSCFSNSGGSSIKLSNTSAGIAAITLNISFGIAFKVRSG